MGKPELLLDNQLCFLVYRLDRLISGRYRPMLSKLGLTYPQYLVMLVLWEHREAGIGELCRLLDLDTGTVSPLVKRLEKMGLVSRERGKRDERSVKVSLTLAGEELEEKAQGIPGALAACLLKDHKEYLELKTKLKDLIGRISSDSCGRFP